MKDSKGGITDLVETSMRDHILRALCRHYQEHKKKGTEMPRKNELMKELEIGADEEHEYDTEIEEMAQEGLIKCSDIELVTHGTEVDVRLRTSSPISLEKGGRELCRKIVHPTPLRMQFTKDDNRNNPEMDGGKNDK